MVVEYSFIISLIIESTSIKSIVSKRITYLFFIRSHFGIMKNVLASSIPLPKGFGKIKTFHRFH